MRLSVAMVAIVAGVDFAAPLPCPAAAPPAPLWTFAWLSDLHLDQGNRDFLAGALRHVGAELRPRFVLFTGDDNSLAAAAEEANRESLGLRRQRFFARFVDEHLRRPFVALPGDNWPEDFERVFGARQRSFDYGGLHFAIVAVDRSHRGKIEGLSVFDPDVRAWIVDDLDRAGRAGLPVVLALHEPVVPCTFLDAPWLRDVLSRSPQVLAVLQGHLHVELAFRAAGASYLVAPSLGRSSPPAFANVAVHADRLVVETHRYDVRQRRFVKAPRSHEIAVPAAARKGLVAPDRFEPTNCREMPPRPHRDDPTLARRAPELLQAIGRSLVPDALGAGRGAGGGP